VQKKQASIKALKKKVINLLRSPDFKPELLKLPHTSTKEVVNALFSFLYNEDHVIKWNAVSAMGAFVSVIAGKDMEAARVIIRRLMWNLNDESGGIGWGSPEAMGEILATQDTLAKEYSSILLSYARENGNFQEHPLMQRGVLWGIGRLYRSRPDLINKADRPHIIPFLDSDDATVRGLAAWVLSFAGADEARSHLEGLKGDKSQVEIYEDHTLVRYRVRNLAQNALKRIATGG
jgi:hypothetical protein